MGNIIKCSFCGKKEIYAKGFCKNCYARYIRRGTPEYFKAQNREEKNKKAREYRKKYSEKIALSKAKWEEKNKERRKEYKKQWYLKNRERILEKHSRGQING